MDLQDSIVQHSRGAGEIVVSLLESKGLGLNATGFPGNTVLALAFRNGDEGIAEMLLEWS